MKTRSIREILGQTDPPTHPPPSKTPIRFSIDFRSYRLINISEKSSVITNTKSTVRAFQ